MKWIICNQEEKEDFLINLKNEIMKFNLIIIIITTQMKITIHILLYLLLTENIMRKELITILIYLSAFHKIIS